jgi:hypothetical protein
MEVTLLNSLLIDALNEPNEQTRVGVFWCYAPDHDIEIYLLKIMLYENKFFIEARGQGFIERYGNKFILRDAYKGEVIFTLDDVLFLIDLWDKADRLIVNTIYIPEHENLA